MKITGINHVGLAASDPEKATWFLRDILGLQYLGSELVAAQKTLTLMFQSSSEPEQVAASRLEILKDESTGDGPIAKFLAKKGGGIHHLALTVDSIDAALAHLKEAGIELIDKVPRIGANGTRIAFVHPRATGGLLVELVEESH